MPGLSPVSRATALPFVMAGVLILSLGAMAAETPELQPAMDVQVTLTDSSGKAINKVLPDKSFRIRATLSNLVGNEPPAGIYLHGWLRPESQRNLACTQAARNYLATGRIPVDGIDLNGPAIAVLTQDHSFNIVDPELDLASANLIGASQFDEAPVDLVADTSMSRFLLSLPDAGEIQSASVFGAQRDTLASGLDRPGLLVPDGKGGVWVLETGSRLLTRVSLNGQLERQTDFEFTHLRQGTANYSIAAANQQGFIVLDRQTGSELARFGQLESAGDRDADADDSALLSDVLPLENQQGTFAVAAVSGDTLFIHYLDAISEPLEIGLPEAATHLAGDADGRFIFAYSPAGGATAIVDIARSHLAQVVGANPPIAQVAFAGRAAFLMLSDQSMAGAIDLSSISIGTHAEVRQVTLGAADTTPRSVAALMTPLTPTNRMLAVHAGSYTGFVIEDSSAMGDAPPMTSVRLRGGIPERVVAIDRSFQEIEPGVFEVSARLPAGGAYELVLTTGIGGLSSCFSIANGEVITAGSREPGRITTLVESGQPERQRLKLEDADGAPQSGVQAEVMFSALDSGWRHRASLVTDANGVSQESYELPPLGAYVVTIQTRNNDSFQPVMLTVDSQ